jgi:hypothetical protein
VNTRDLFLPVFFGSCAAAVWYFNDTHDAAKLVFPLIGYIPGYESTEAQAVGTVRLFLLIAITSACWSLFGGLRRPPGMPRK